MHTCKEVELKRECFIYENMVEVSCHILFLSKGGCTHQLCTHQHTHTHCSTDKKKIVICLPRIITQVHTHWHVLCLRISFKVVHLHGPIVVWTKIASSGNYILLNLGGHGQTHTMMSSVLAAVVRLAWWAFDQHFHHYTACTAYLYSVWIIVLWRLLKCTILSHLHNNIIIDMW